MREIQAKEDLNKMRDQTQYNYLKRTFVGGTTLGQIKEFVDDPLFMEDLLENHNKTMNELHLNNTLLKNSMAKPQAMKPLFNSSVHNPILL